MSDVAGLVLAAGAGSRLGTPKALVELDGELLPLRAARLLAAGGCRPVTVVLGASAAEARSRLASAPSVGAEVRVVEATDWAQGMASSLRTGLGALPVQARAVVVALADQPLLGPELVPRLVQAWRGGAVAAVACFDGAPRNPVLLDRAVWDEVAAAAEGDSGARAWLRAHPELVEAVECGDVGDALDVDFPADLTRALRHRDLHPREPSPQETP